MLRTASAAAITAGDPLGMASFPLVPYSNRVGQAVFDWAGQLIHLTQNFLPEPHAIHGLGWQSDWAVDAVSQTAASITLLHSPDDRWPWAFAAHQLISLTDTSLTLDLRVRNLEHHPVPLAFGHHPYFDQAGARLRFAAEQVWMIGEDGLPSSPQVPEGSFDFHNRAAVEGRAIDHCYAGVSGPARIEWDGRSLALEIGSTPQLPAAVVYIPKDGDSFCFEPVPHINNALNLPGARPAMPVIAAGEVFETRITLTAVAK
jgi:aldose 1-epimerase